MHMKSILVMAAVAASVAAPASAQPVLQDVVELRLSEANGGFDSRSQSIVFASADPGRSIVADQVLMAVVTDTGTGAVRVDSGSFETGANRIGDNAFAVFSGMLTQSWNSGINANSQAATNVAWGSAGEGMVRFSAAAGDRGNR